MNTFKINDNWEYFNLDNKIKDINLFFEENKNKTNVIFDFKELENIDSSGIILIIKYLVLFEKNNISVLIENISDKHKKMLELYKGNYIHKDSILRKEPSFIQKKRKEKRKKREGEEKEKREKSRI